MNTTLQDALNNQIAEELYSGYLYVAMSAYAAHKGLKGLQNWFYVQALEERDHALGIQNNLLDRGGKVVLQALKQPPSEFAGPLHMFQEALKHEQHISGTIHALMDLSIAEKDYPMQSFLKWYVDEQVEEEATASDMIDKVQMAGESGAGFFALDSVLAKRQYSPSSILESSD